MLGLQFVGRLALAIICRVVVPPNCALTTAGKMEMNAISQGQSPQAGENFAKAGFYVGLVVTILTCLLGVGYIFLIFLGVLSSSF